jgi:C4-dicarboxylate-binding protein DctP
MKFYEVQKYMVLDGHLYNPLFIFINNEFYTTKLTPAQQKVVAQAAGALALSHNGFSQDANIKGIAQLKGKGMQIYQPTGEEISKFRSVAQPASLTFIKEKAGEDWTKKALDTAAATEKKIGGKADATVQQTIAEANKLYSENVKK